MTGVGLAVVGRGDDSAGALRCDAMAGSGGLDCIDEVAVVRAGSAGIYLAGDPDGTTAPRVELRRLAVLQIRRSIDDRGGDGIYVGANASAMFEPTLPARMREGSLSVVGGNARSGVLVSGGLVVLQGSAIVDNGSAGIFLQGHAQAMAVNHNLLLANSGLGIGALPSTTLGEITCNGIADTRVARIMTNVGPIEVGDGVSVAGSMSGRFEENTISRSERYAMVFRDVSTSAVVAHNHGEGNLYRDSYYGRERPTETDNHIASVAGQPERDLTGVPSPQ